MHMITQQVAVELAALATPKEGSRQKEKVMRIQYIKNKKDNFRFMKKTTFLKRVNALCVNVCLKSNFVNWYYRHNFTILTHVNDARTKQVFVDKVCRLN